MNKRRGYCLLIAALLVVFAIWLEPTRVAWGWLRGEAFYQGRPTSYWATQIGHWQLCGKGTLNWREEPFDTWHFCYTPSVFHKWFVRDWKSVKRVFPCVLEADSLAHTVLAELAVYSDSHVSEIARERLRGTRMDSITIRGGVGP